MTFDPLGSCMFGQILPLGYGAGGLMPEREEEETVRIQYIGRKIDQYKKLLEYSILIEKSTNISKKINCCMQHFIFQTSIVKQLELGSL